jgi:glucosylceramidase
MSKPIRVFQTAQETDDRLKELDALAFGPVPDYTCQWVIADPAYRFQTIEGFGGAFTEAGAVTLQKLGAAKQDEVMRAYFDPEHGHGYTLCRTHINSCDFSLGNYAYTETPGDVALRDFTIARDHQALIPMIKHAMRVRGPDLKIFASPWSPPAWMKTNGRMNTGGALKPEYRAAWAQYYCHYVEEYARAGVPLWGLTVQNEPITESKWDNCLWTPEEERDFIRDYLGPALHQHGLKYLKLMAWDQNRNRIFERARTILEDPEAARYVWGLAYHWYAGDNFENLRFVHDIWPDKKLLFSEGCQEGGAFPGSWTVAERYGFSVINDLNRWSVGWTDWNMVLDENGGPNHAGNFTHAPILVDTRTGEVMVQPSFAYLGHFSRFIKPGAQRIVASTTRDDLQTTAFVNPDGRVAVVVMNKTDNAAGFTLRYRQVGAKTQCPAHSIRTFIFEQE